MRDQAIKTIPETLSIKDQLYEARRKLAGIQALLMLPGEKITDDAREWAEIEADRIRDTIAVTLQVM